MYAKLKLDKKRCTPKKTGVILHLNLPISNFSTMETYLCLQLSGRLGEVWLAPLLCDKIIYYIYNILIC